MAIYFIECGEMKNLLIEEEKKVIAPPAIVGIGLVCCTNCHSNKRNLIYVFPFRDEVGNPAWGFCIEAEICCALYDKVRALPTEWWEKIAKEKGVFRSRDDGRGYIFSDTPERNTDREKVSPTTKAAKVQKTIKGERDREEEGGLAGWSK